MTNLTLDWWNEKVEKVPSKNWLYKLCCLFLAGRKFTYKELYIFYIEVNGGNKAEESAKVIKKRCLEQVLNVYYFNNNKIPEEMEIYVG